MAGHFSNFTFTSTPEDFVAGVTESSDATAVYPPTGTQTATYNTLNQLTNLSGQALTWDTVGNLTADGQRTYTWDAENRLVGIGYPGQPGKATAFAYDGLGRRVAITETPPGGGTPVTTNYLWCGDALCQARDGSNVTTRSYYDEGEFVPGSPGQPYFYGIDQLGSVRRAFASTTSAPAFNYDPYGVPLSGPAPTTDFGFAGLFNHPASGLSLTLYRAYDPVAGRWLSQDPIGEGSDPYGNLYAYVASDTPNFIDPSGLGAIRIEFRGYPVEVPGVGRLPLGHGAIVSVDEKTGRTRYYEYGRYDREGAGVVLRRQVPDVQIGPDGRPTQESLRKLYEYISKHYGRDSPVVAEYDPKADFDRVNEFAERRMRDPNRPRYNLFINNCFTFSDQAMRAGRGR